MADEAGVQVVEQDLVEPLADARGLRLFVLVRV